MLLKANKRGRYYYAQGRVERIGRQLKFNCSTGTWRMDCHAARTRAHTRGRRGGFDLAERLFSEAARVLFKTLLRIATARLRHLQTKLNQANVQRSLKSPRAVPDRHRIAFATTTCWAPDAQHARPG